MADLVVTVPLSFGLERWIAEGDPAGSKWSGQLWDFSVPTKPRIAPGERVYVVYNGKLRGYAPLVRLEQEIRSEHTRGRWHLVRGGGAVAVTILEVIAGFRGFRYRWWERAAEVPFPLWREV